MRLPAGATPIQHRDDVPRGCRTIRLYPERDSTLYVRVHVWPTRRAMLAFLRRTGRPLGTETVAVCTGTERWKVVGDRLRKNGQVAEVNFFRARLGTQVVTHELFHATLAWARRAKIDWTAVNTDPINDLEERVTHVHSTMCAHLVRRLTDLGYYAGAE